MAYALFATKKVFRCLPSNPTKPHKQVSKQVQQDNDAASILPRPKKSQSDLFNLHCSKIKNDI